MGMERVAILTGHLRAAFGRTPWSTVPIAARARRLAHCHSSDRRCHLRRRKWAASDDMSARVTLIDQ